MNEGLGSDHRGKGLGYDDRKYEKKYEKAANNADYAEKYGIGAPI